MQPIQLDPDNERRLLELAKRTGRTTHDLIEEGIGDLEDRYSAAKHVEMRQLPLSSAGVRKEVAQARAAAWRDSVINLPRTPPLSDEAISRHAE